MPRPLSELSKQILLLLDEHGSQSLDDLYEQFENEHSKKKIYDTIFRLTSNGLTKLEKDLYRTAKQADILLHTIARNRDGIWKMIIFDIPEKKRQVRNVLRAKLVSLGFKKWQNSIWMSPYTLAPEIEAELNELAKVYFIRLIKTTDINYDKDLEALFTDDQ
ncbi:MAG: hypothetical protein R3B41_02820 [Candidatus Doudnabacteria bacterium]